MAVTLRRWCARLLLFGGLVPGAFAQQKSYSWQQLRDRFLATNVTLKAVSLSVDESKAQEITAFLRPNPELGVSVDQFQLHPAQPFANLTQVGALNYLHERQHKRELRRESALRATSITASQLEDQKRTLLFNLRSGFIQALQAKAVLANAIENLQYWDRQLQIANDRLRAGDIAEVDHDRLELQRIQFEADVQNATVSLRTAKIQLLTLLNDRTPVEQFDVTGPYDFTAAAPTREEFRAMALEARPDLQAALQAVEKAQTDHRLALANGSADPIFGFDAGRNPPFQAYMGFSMQIPLRIFDRNQGEKLRTEIEITRNQRLVEAAKAQVFSDVDSAYATLESSLTLLQPYKQRYLPRAVKVRDTVSYAYQRGGVSLLDYLDAQKSYRDVELSYLNLIGSFLTAAGQLNLAVGREVLP